MKLTVKEITLCALAAATTVVFSQMAIPIGPVPINFAHIAIFVFSCLLKVKLAVLAQCAFLLLGALGLPVFSNLSGGFAVFVGPVGGFLVGYIACAFVVSVLSKSSNHALLLGAVMFIGLLVNYVFGISFMMFVMEISIWEALLIGLFPFIIGDSVKIFLSVILVKRLRRLNLGES